jgi:hypothetical protein
VIAWPQFHNCGQRKQIAQTEDKAMIDYTVSMIARMEHEERIRSLTPVHDYDVWLTHIAGHWQSQPLGGLLASLGKGLTILGARLKPKREAALDSSLVEQERGGMPG